MMQNKMRLLLSALASAGAADLFSKFNLLVLHQITEVLATFMILGYIVLYVFGIKRHLDIFATNMCRKYRIDDVEAEIVKIKYQLEKNKCPKPKK